MSQTPVHARWDGFLSQIRERFQDVMRESQEGCPQLLEQAGFDPVPLGNAWGAMEMRAKALDTKIEETWGAQVESAFEQAGVLPQGIAYEREKGRQLREWMEVERERVRIGIFADAARKLIQRATAEMQGGFRCSRCGATLQVPPSFRALNVPCAHCNTMNGFEPGMKMRMVEAFCVHPLCEEAAWRELMVLKASEKAYRDARPTTIYVLKDMERAQIQYYRAYLAARARWLPDTTASIDVELAGRMRAFYDRVENERAWVEAGRPREPG